MFLDAFSRPSESVRFVKQYRRFERTQYDFDYMVGVFLFFFADAFQEAIEQFGRIPHASKTLLGAGEQDVIYDFWFGFFSTFAVHEGRRTIRNTKFLVETMKRHDLSGIIDDIGCIVVMDRMGRELGQRVSTLLHETLQLIGQFVEGRVVEDVVDDDVGIEVHGFVVLCGWVMDFKSCF